MNELPVGNIHRLSESYDSRTSRSPDGSFRWNRHRHQQKSHARQTLCGEIARTQKERPAIDALSSLMRLGVGRPTPADAASAWRVTAQTCDMFVGRNGSIDVADGRSGVRRP